jgi:ABC-2 type transport system permease protein
MKILSLKDRAILREMVSSDFKVRYQGSVLGYLWSLLRPLFMFCILFVVFTYVIPLGKSVPHYAVQLFLGIVLWNFFNEATTTSLGSIVSSGDIIRKIRIPRYLIVVASSVAALINLLLNLIVLFIFISIDGVPFRVEWLLLPVIIIELYALAQAAGFFLAAANVRFRDVRYIWELVIQAGFYATPIIYMASKVPVEYQKFFMLNPMAQIIQDTRWMIIGGDTVTLWSQVGLFWALTPITIIAIIAVIAVAYFKKQAPNFAEDI